MKAAHILEEPVGDRWDYGSAYVTHSNIGDASHVAANLRAADRAELAAITRIAPLRLIEDGILESSRAYTVWIKESGDPCAIFGVRDSGHPGLGIVWMLGTDDLFRIAHKFLRGSRSWIKVLQHDFKVIFNVIDARQDVYIKWLRWLGFKFVQDFEKYGIGDKEFRMFIRHDF
jgi:hypothetical protein